MTGFNQSDQRAFPRSRVGPIRMSHPDSTGSIPIATRKAVRMSHLARGRPAKRLRELVGPIPDPIGLFRSPPGLHPRGRRARAVGRLDGLRKRTRGRRRCPRGHLWSMFGARRLAFAAHSPRGHLRCGPFDTAAASPARHWSPRRPSARTRRKVRASLARSARLVASPGRCHSRRRFDTMPSDAARPATTEIMGATGTLGQAFSKICASRPAHVLTSRAELDSTDEASIAAAFLLYKPWAVINTAGFAASPKPKRCPTNASRSTRPGRNRLPRRASSAESADSLSPRTWCSTVSGRSYVEPDATARRTLWAQQGRGRNPADGGGRRCADHSAPAPFSARGIATTFSMTRSIARRGEDVVRVTRHIGPRLMSRLIAQPRLTLMLDEEKGIWHRPIRRRELARNGLRNRRPGEGVGRPGGPRRGHAKADTSLSR